MLRSYLLSTTATHAAETTGTAPVKATKGNKKGKVEMSGPSIFYDDDGNVITTKIGSVYRQRALEQMGDNPVNDLSHLSDEEIEHTVRRVTGDGIANDEALDKQRLALVIASEPPADDEDYVPGDASVAGELGEMASDELNEDLVRFADARETLAGGPVIIAWDCSHNPKYVMSNGNRLDALPIPGSRYDDDEVEAAKKKGIIIETDYYETSRNGKKATGQRWREWVERTKRGKEIVRVINLLGLLVDDYTGFQHWDELARLTNNEETRDTIPHVIGVPKSAKARWVARLNTMTNRVRMGERCRRQCERIDALAKVTWNYAISDRFDKKLTIQKLRVDAKRSGIFQLSAVLPTDPKTGKQTGKPELCEPMSVGSFVNLKLDKAIAVDGGSYTSIMATKVRTRKKDGGKKTTIPQSPTGAEAEEMLPALLHVFSARGKAYTDLVIALTARNARAERKTLGDLVGHLNDLFAQFREQYTNEEVARRNAEVDAKEKKEKDAA